MFELIPNEKIKEVIELLNGGLTFRDIKNKTGVSLGTISKIKNGIIEPNRKEENNNFINNDEFIKIQKDRDYWKEEYNRLELIYDKNIETISKLRNELEQLKKQIVNDPKEQPQKKLSLKERLNRINAFDNDKE